MLLFTLHYRPEQNVAMGEERKDLLWLIFEDFVRSLESTSWGSSGGGWMSKHHLLEGQCNISGQDSLFWDMSSRPHGCAGVWYPVPMVSVASSWAGSRLFLPSVSELSPKIWDPNCEQLHLWDKQFPFDKFLFFSDLQIRLWGSPSEILISTQGHSFLRGEAPRPHSKVNTMLMVSGTWSQSWGKLWRRREKQRQDRIYFLWEDDKGHKCHTISLGFFRMLLAPNNRNHNSKWLQWWKILGRFKHYETWDFYYFWSSLHTKERIITNSILLGHSSRAQKALCKRNTLKFKLYVKSTSSH